MEIKFDPARHLYVVDGEPFPSVTTIIKAVVPVPFDRAAWWGYKMAQQGLRMDEKRNSAAVMGTNVHSYFEDVANGWEPDEFDHSGVGDPDVFHGYVDAVHKFIDDNDPEFHGSEVRTASLEHIYAGTLDAFLTFRKGKYKGKSARIDVKTGRAYPETHWPQLEAYEGAEVERGQPASDARFVLDLKPTGKYRLIESLDTFQDFKVLLDHYRSAEDRKLRRKKK